jgi:hypothetical protein
MLELDHGSDRPQDVDSLAAREPSPGTVSFAQEMRLWQLEACNARASSIAPNATGRA